MVTNKHVVSDAVEGWITVHTSRDAKVELGKGFRAKVGKWQSWWFGHPNPEVDIAVLPLLPLLDEIRDKYNKEVFLRPIPSDMFISRGIEIDLDALEEVVFVGYPNGIWDKLHQLPVVRRGTTASPLQVDFEGDSQFVIDASVFGGSSGSPVFVYSSGVHGNRQGTAIAGSRAIFVGVVTSVYYRTALNRIVSVPIPTAIESMAEQSEMLDLGLVTKARAVTETIEAFMSEYARHNPTPHHT